jgi:hypothetical protein
MREYHGKGMDWLISSLPFPITNFIPSFHRVKTDAKFILKTLMTICPGTVLMLFTATLWMIGGYILRLCERYISNNDEWNIPNNFVIFLGIMTRTTQCWAFRQRNIKVTWIPFGWLRSHFSVLDMVCLDNQHFDRKKNSLNKTPSPFKGTLCQTRNAAE